MVSSFCDIELLALASVENPKIGSYAECIDPERNQSLFLWRNKAGSKGFYLEKGVWGGPHCSSVGSGVNYAADSGPDTAFVPRTPYHVPTNPP